MDDDDILAEILLRLPPQPSSLPRAALVCKRWCRLVADPQFARRFRAHHRTPPLLGFLIRHGHRDFVSTQDPPDRVSAARFSLPQRGGEASIWGWQLLGCRHGLVLYENTKEFLVFDPMSGDDRRVLFSAAHEVLTFITAAVVSVAGSVDHASFSLVALFTDDSGIRASASVYSSDSGVWCDSLATSILPSPIVFVYHPGTLVGNAIYWLLDDGVILQFDLETQNLAVIEKPPGANVWDALRCQIIPAEDGCFGLAVLAESSMLFWKRETYIGNAGKWVMCRTVQLDKFLPLGKKRCLLGISEENDVIFLGTHVGVFMVHLRSMQFKKMIEEPIQQYIYPYSNFCSAVQVFCFFICVSCSFLFPCLSLIPFAIGDPFFSFFFKMSGNQKSSETHAKKKLKTHNSSSKDGSDDAVAEANAAASLALGASSKQSKAPQVAPPTFGFQPPKML